MIKVRRSHNDYNQDIPCPLSFDKHAMECSLPPMNTQAYTRSPQLSLLSKEHEDGILFVKRVRYGLGQVSIDRLRCYTCWYWKNHIRPHFFQEEKILLPHMPADHPLAIKLKEDHAYIRDLVLSLDQEAEPSSFRALGDVIAEHIRFEEQQVFTYLEQHVAEEALNDICLQLKEHPVEGGEWIDIFWVDMQS